MEQQAAQFRELPKQTIKTIDRGEKTVRTAGKTGQTVKNTGKGTIKTAAKSVKTAEQTAEKTVKTTKEAAKTAKAAARASVKTAEKTVQMARQAVRAAEQAAKAAAKATASAVKAIIAGTKALVSAIAAGGWVAVLILIIVLLFGGLLCMVGGGNSSTVSPVSAEVEAYEPVIRIYARQYGIEEYVELIKVVMMQESGGQGSDPMQSSESGYNTRFIWEYVFVNRHIEHRNKLDKQLDTWILSLVFDRLDMSGSIADYSRKLFPCHSFDFTDFLDSLSYRSKIEVKMIVPFIH